MTYDYHDPIKPELAVRKTIKERLIYNSKTGTIKWLNPSGTKVKIGDIAGCYDSLGRIYVSVTINKKQHRYAAHQVAWFLYYGKWPKKSIDHHDGNPSNNKIKNLREASSSQQSYNQKIHKNNTSGTPGVTFDKTANKWRAQIRVNKIGKTVGRYEFIEDAIADRLKAEKLYHKDFALSKRPKKLFA